MLASQCSAIDEESETTKQKPSGVGKACRISVRIGLSYLIEMIVYARTEKFRTINGCPLHFWRVKGIFCAPERLDLDIHSNDSKVQRLGVQHGQAAGTAQPRNRGG